jgi:hypothetical protein
LETEPVPEEMANLISAASSFQEADKCGKWINSLKKLSLANEAGYLVVSLLLILPVRLRVVQSLK